MGLDPTTQEHVDSYLIQINRSELCSRVCEGSTRSGIWVVAWWVGNWYWVTFRGDGGNWEEMRLTESRGTVKRFLGRFTKLPFQ